MKRNEKLYKDALDIALSAVKCVMPDAAVKRAFNGKMFSGRVVLIAVGKAAWRMARAALEAIPVSEGIVISKYGHIEHELPGIKCFEAGHPVPDENGLIATQAVLDLTRDLTAEDTVLFLLSGGGSALFEKPLIPLVELQEITDKLLARGADITEINTVRKHLSRVKGGRFAEWCSPAHIEAVVLSDVLGDPPDVIASGPVSPDRTTASDAAAIAEKYDLKLSENAMKHLMTETPKETDNVELQIVGSVKELCRAAGNECLARGYEPVFLTDLLDCEARDAGRFMGAVLKAHAKEGRKLAFIAGGETVVHIKGYGVGGRNQELALASCEQLAGLGNAALISIGSDGTDGPCDAAGGYADGDTFACLKEQGIDVYKMLENNDSYHALKASGGLIITGPTGTNVNDVVIGLIEKEA